MRRLRDKTPVIETYIQEMKPDEEFGPVPKNDYYFLGQLNMKDGLVDMSYLPPRPKLKALQHLLATSVHHAIQFAWLCGRALYRRARF